MAAVVAVLCCRIRMPGFFACLPAAAVGEFSGRRIGYPGGLVHDPAVAVKNPAFCVWVQSGQSAEKAGLRGGRYETRRVSAPRLSDAEIDNCSRVRYSRSRPTSLAAAPSDSVAAKIVGPQDD